MKDKHKTRSEIIDGIDENTKYIPVIKDMICPNKLKESHPMLIINMKL